MLVDISRPYPNNRTSTVRGVYRQGSYSDGTPRYRAVIRDEERLVHLGYYRDLDQAQRHWLTERHRLNIEHGYYGNADKQRKQM